MQQLEHIIQDAIAVAKEYGALQPDRSRFYDDGEVSILHAIYGDLVVAVRVGDDWQTVLHTTQDAGLVTFQRLAQTASGAAWVHHISNTHLGVARSRRVGQVNLVWKLAYEYWLLQRQIESLLCLAVMMDALMLDYTVATKGYFIHQIPSPYGEDLPRTCRATLQFVCGERGGDDHVGTS